MQNNFLWGVASSSFQTEGHIENDMTKWEAAGHFKKNGKNPVYGQGSNHWYLWEKDFELLKTLGVNAYRFSIEWARIEPEPGQFNEKALLQYEKMIDRLLELQITPMCTLHHFSHPHWFHNYSPWTAEESQHTFLRFAKIIFERFASKITLWNSFNEPLVWALAAYGDAQFPPGEKNPQKVLLAVKNILEAHAQTYDLLKSINPKAQIGIAKHFIIFKEQRSWFLPDRGLANRLNYFFNRMILKAFVNNRLQFQFRPILNFDQPINLNNKIDFWGVNYYYRLHTKLSASFFNPLKLIHKNPETDMGWEIYPKGLLKILRLLQKYEKDIYITENGCATENNPLRDSFIEAHLKMAKKFLNESVLLKGYFHWSFLDNYEWLEGKSKRFGLVHVDYENEYKRTIKSSAELFKARQKDFQT